VRRGLGFAEGGVRKKFTAKLKSIGPGGAWTLLEVPFNVEKVFGSRARVSVHGTLNKFAFRSSILPMGTGRHTMMVNRQMQKGAGARPGNVVRVVMEPDTAPRRVFVPPNFRKALAGNPAAKDFFDGLSYSHRKDYVTWIRGAKQAETRARRIAKALAMLAAGKKWM
jgi:hypothetical protein